MTISEQNKDKRDVRKKRTAEIFSPPKLVNEMLDKLPKEVWKENKTFCDPACGNGNFLYWILLRKIAKGHNPIESLKSVYGVDIMRDNIQECRMRLLKVISDSEIINEEHIRAVFKNIKWIDIKRHPLGSLEYDFSFSNVSSQKTVDRWMKRIHDEHELDQIELPIEEEKFVSSHREIDLFEDEENLLN